MQQDAERRGEEPERGLDAAEITGTGTGNDSMGIANAARRADERGRPEGMGEPNTATPERAAEPDADDRAPDPTRDSAVARVTPDQARPGQG